MLRTFSRTNKIICIASNHTLKTLLILTFFPCTLTFSLFSSLSFFPFSLARRHYSFCFTVSFLRFLFFYIFFSFFFFDSSSTRNIILDGTDKLCHYRNLRTRSNEDFGFIIRSAKIRKIVLSFFV